MDDESGDDNRDELTGERRRVETWHVCQLKMIIRTNIYY